MEPIILELEREENDLLIIAHESVLRVLYGYLMACNAADIPKLEFPRDEIIEVCIIALFPSKVSFSFCACGVSAAYRLLVSRCPH